MQNLIRFVVFCFFTGQALAQALPPLNFDAPAGYSGGGEDGATFTSPEGGVVVHVYPFRRLGIGDFKARFRDNLLREFVAADARESKLAAPARIEDVSVEGAEASGLARFADERGGAQRERTRLAIFAAGAVAIVDVIAPSGAAERGSGVLKAMLESMSVGQPKARAAPPPIIATPEIAATVPAPATAPAPQAAAPAPPPPPFGPGMYVGNVRRLIPAFVGGVQSGGMWVTGPQYYLLSSDGLAYRSYDPPRGAGGDPAKFDWQRARREDAANTGTYELAGNQLTLRLGNETISAKLAGPGRFEIFGNYFKRAMPK
jgi:hypothetical protein